MSLSLAPGVLREEENGTGKEYPRVPLFGNTLAEYPMLSLEGHTHRYSETWIWLLRSL